MGDLHGVGSVAIRPTQYITVCSFIENEGKLLILKVHLFVSLKSIHFHHITFTEWKTYCVFVNAFLD